MESFTRESQKIRKKKRFSRNQISHDPLKKAHPVMTQNQKSSRKQYFLFNNDKRI